ncbi:MAG: Oligopeptide transport ATP-binding protein OppD [Rhizobacter sp.]|nr:Oligopeptide transport ATP-binding protein OppD [Rhizobacter sp.]
MSLHGLVEIRDLTISYRMAEGQGAVRALDGVSLSLQLGESLGIVGESGSGKSTLGMAIGRLLAPNAQIVQGDIEVEGRSTLACTATELRALRRDRLGFVFQNPMTALDPTMRVGRQIALALGKAASREAIEALIGRVGLPDAAAVAAKFPHELSGGMAQRVVIAQAIARKPAVLIADEPTASLDASIQGVILDLLTSLRTATGASLVIMSHDLHMIALRCERMAVMYGGRVIESGASRRIFEDPRHPYTQALIKAAAGNEGPGGELHPIPGVPPVLRGASSNCAFASRCAFAQPRCFSERPAEYVVDERVVACHFALGGLTRSAEPALAT